MTEHRQDEVEHRWSEYERLAAEARLHPGYVEYERIAALARMTRIMRTNHNELMALLEHARTDAEFAGIIASNTPAFAAKRDDVYGEITRRLLNFLNGAASLVDHVRIIMKDRTSSVATAHRERVDEFVKDGSWSFVRDLRNLVHHVRLPFLGHHASFGRNPTGGLVMTNAIVQLDRSDLLQWRGWKPEAERYLLACPDEIALQPLMQRVGDALGDLHVRLHGELQDENRPARRAVNEIITRAHAQLHGGDEEQARRFLEDFHGVTVDEL